MTEMTENLSETPTTPPPPGEADSPARRKSLRYEMQDDVPFNAVSHTHPHRLAKTQELAIVCARIADDNRASHPRQSTPPGVAAIRRRFALVG